MLLLLIHAALCFLPAQNPSWEHTYVLNRSTIAMLINASGWTHLKFAANFGIASIDWSNARAYWVDSKPMDCEERLLYQARRIKEFSPSTHVFVYRNLVKALPWFSSVRKIITDPQYSGFFLNFAEKQNPSVYHVPPCTTQANITKCSGFYHDQEQTPQVPSNNDPHPAGSCKDYCDCGAVPCGEYLFDHRNESLTEWLVNEYIISDTALGSPYIDGLFIDDFWCSDIINGSKHCNDPVQGPSEIDPNSQFDMGLSNHTIADITRGWLYNMQQVQQAIVEVGGYTWSLIPGQANANAMPMLVYAENCKSILNRLCKPSNSLYQNAPLIFGISPNITNPSDIFPNITQQLAAFLLIRGPYAYVGYGQWGMTWPSDVAFPDAIFGAHNYGTPINNCTAHPSQHHTYFRNWTNGFVQLDCNRWSAVIEEY